MGSGTGTPEGLTDQLNRNGLDPERAERVRMEAIRERVATILLREAGGLGGSADAWVERPGLTCLAQDVWLRLEGSGPWESRAHFLGAVARSARQVLIDLARKRQRRHEQAPVDHAQDVDTLPDPTPGDAARLLEIERLLHELAREGSPNCERAARVAGLRLFGGLSSSVIAEAEGLSTRTVERDWLYARAWLAEALARDELAQRV